MRAENQALPEPRHILITGASSGIGAALARAYAAPGMRLALFGRDEEHLRAVAEAVRARGALVAAVLVDVRDQEAMRTAVSLVDDAHPLDLAIANAGVSGGSAGQEGTAAWIFAVNLIGTAHTVEPLLPRFVRRRRGHLALMSSLASFLPSPHAAAYGASKAAVRLWGEALGARLAAEGVRVSVICPGFIDTPLTRSNPFPMPLLMPPERAAAIIKRGLDAGRARIAFPWPAYAAARLAGLLPAGLVHRATGRWPGKE